MKQQDFFDDGDGPRRAHFNGADYDPEKDDKRLTKQLGRVYAAMIKGDWMTLGQIRSRIRLQTGKSDPEASISAQIRHLRKDRFGAYNIERQRTERNEALWEYRLNGRKDED